jgi:hypothetical protein
MYAWLARTYSRGVSSVNWASQSAPDSMNLGFAGAIPNDMSRAASVFEGCGAHAAWAQLQPQHQCGLRAARTRRRAKQTKPIRYSPYPERASAQRPSNPGSNTKRNENRAGRRKGHRRTGTSPERSNPHLKRPQKSPLEQAGRGQGESRQAGRGSRGGIPEHGSSAALQMQDYLGFPLLAMELSPQPTSHSSMGLSG